MRWRNNTDWQETDGTVASVQEYQTKAGRCYSVVFTYKVDGHYCGGTFTTFTPYREGDAIGLKYDPADPDRNNLTDRERNLNRFYALFFVALGVLAVYLFLHPKSR